MLNLGTMSFVSRSVDYFLENNIKYELLEHNVIHYGDSTAPRFEFKGHIVTEESKNFVSKNIIAITNNGIQIDVEYNYEIVTHPPVAKYSYKYENMEVECCYCEEKIMSNDLESDSTIDFYSNAICPKCGEWDCCELVYENINEYTNNN